MKLERVYKIISFCLQQNRYVSLEELSEVIDKSVATVRLELEHLQHFLDEFSVKVKTKRGVGIKLELTQQQRHDVLVALDKLKQHHQDLNESDYQIVSYLLQHINKDVRLADISQALYLSESVIQKKITALKPVMASYRVHVRTIPGKGIEIVGDEQHIRKVYANLLFKKQQSEDITFSKPIELKDKIISFLGLNPDPIFKAIEYCETFLGYSFSDESVQSLAIHIAIAIKRIFDDKHMESVVIDSQDLSKKEYQAAVEMYQKIGNSYQIHFSESEIYYLFLHILSTKVVKNDEVNHIASHFEGKTERIAYQIKGLVENIKQVSIEQRFIDNLILHLRPTINRLEYDLVLDNPLIDKIKQEYPEAFGIAWMCNVIFVREIGKGLSEDEVGYIALHIQAMLEGVMPSIKTVIVCSSGVGISQLLSTQIAKTFKSIEIVDVMGVLDFQYYPNKQQIEMVISTFPIETTIPSIVVNPILNQYDIQRINDFVQMVRVPKQQNVIGRVYLKQSFESKNDLIEWIGNELLKHKEVTEDFATSILQREAVNTTEIGNGFALPHGDSQCIKKSQVVIVTLKEPILWEEYTVDVIIFVLVHEQDKKYMTNRLRTIYKKLYTESFHQACLNADDVKTIKQLFDER